MLPLIIVIDLDGTIIGDISPQITTYEIMKEVKRNGGNISYKGKDFPDKLKAGIIRPHFQSFINTLNSKVTNIEFYVYTASEKTWANHMIKNIEKTLNIKINRPIFTRTNCFFFQNEYKKSLKNIKKPIFNSLKKKYIHLKNENDLNNRILVIDNMDVYQTNEKHKHILCDTYDYKYPENIGGILTVDEYNKNWQVISKILNKHYGLEITDDYIDFQMKYYKWYISYLERTSVSNIKFKEDRFFKYLKKIMLYVLVDKKYETFNENVIKYINKNLERLCKSRDSI